MKASTVAFMDMHSSHPCPLQIWAQRERAFPEENAFFRGDISIPLQKSCLRTACEHLQHPDVTHLDGRTERELLSFRRFNYPDRMPGQTRWCLQVHRTVCISDKWEKNR